MHDVDATSFCCPRHVHVLFCYRVSKISTPILLVFDYAKSQCTVVRLHDNWIWTLVEGGARGWGGYAVSIIIYLTVYHRESFIQFDVRIIIFSSHVIGHSQQSHYGTRMHLPYANVVQHCHHIDHGQLDFFFELVGILHTSNYHTKQKSGQ